MKKATSGWTASEITEVCNEEHCPATQAANYNRAIGLANVSNVAFSVAALGITLGIVGLVLDADEPTADERPEVAVEPVLGPGAAGLRGSF